MQVISKASFMFVKNPLEPGRLEFTIHPTGANPVEIPDWCEKDPTFLGAVEDGNLTPVIVRATKPNGKPKTEEKQVKTGLRG